MFDIIKMCCVCGAWNCEFSNILETNDGDLKLIDKLKYCVSEVVRKLIFITRINLTKEMLVTDTNCLHFRHYICTCLVGTLDRLFNFDLNINYRSIFEVINRYCKYQTIYNQNISFISIIKDL